MIKKKQMKKINLKKIKIIINKMNNLKIKTKKFQKKKLKIKMKSKQMIKIKKTKIKTKTKTKTNKFIKFNAFYNLIIIFIIKLTNFSKSFYKFSYTKKEIFFMILPDLFFLK